MKNRGNIPFRKHSRAVQKAITSDELAEKFIARWVKRYATNRKDALRRLRELGVQYPKPKAITGFLKRVA